GDAQRHRVDHRQMGHSTRPERCIDQCRSRAHRMPDDAYRFLWREDLERAVQVSDVLDEVIEAARPDPLRITVPAEIHRDGPTGQQGREQVEGAGVIEPAVQQQRELALAAFDAVELQATDVEQAVVHGAEANNLTGRAPFATGARWRIPSSASSWAARPTSRCCMAPSTV